MANNGKALQKNGTEYVALQSQDDSIAELLKSNLGSRRIDPWNFDTATWPSGRATSFELPTLEGTKPVKEIIGIILHWNEGRVYYEKDFDEGGGLPPDCHSTDLIKGNGNPGKFSKEEAEAEGQGIEAGESKSPDMLCMTCWNAQFDTAVKGAGQACRERRQIFLLQPDSILPLFISVPPTSLKEFSRFFMRLSTKGKFFNKVVVKISLNKTKSKSGQDYAEAQIEYVRDLNAKEKESIESYSKAVKNLFG